MHRFSWGMIISVLALVVFALVAWQAHVEGSPLWQFDRRLAVAMQEHAEAHPEVLEFFRGVTEAGGVPVMTALAIVGALLLWCCERRQLAVLWLVAASLGAVIDLSAKEIIASDRPGEALRDSAVSERNRSYPSGHAMGSVIGYGSLAYVGTVLLRRRWAKALLVALVAALVLLIGLSRIYLRAHWFSDVIGGFAIGICWLWACITILARRGEGITAQPGP